MNNNSTPIYPRFQDKFCRLINMQNGLPMSDFKLGPKKSLYYGHIAPGSDGTFHIVFLCLDGRHGQLGIQRQDTAFSVNIKEKWRIVCRHQLQLNILSYRPTIISLVTKAGFVVNTNFLNRGLVNEANCSIYLFCRPIFQSWVKRSGLLKCQVRTGSIRNTAPGRALCLICQRWWQPCNGHWKCRGVVKIKLRCL